VGLIAGSLAKRATGVRGFGCLGTMAVGIVGGLVGGILFNAVGEHHGMTRFGLKSLLIAFVGAHLGAALRRDPAARRPSSARRAPGSGG